MFLILCGSTFQAFPQGNLYTARGYWEESTKKPYLDMKRKIEKGDSLSVFEKSYVKDYEAYLGTYFQKMQLDEQNNYMRLRYNWDLTLQQQEINAKLKNSDFEWRTKDRLTNGLYGLVYGGAIVSVGGITGPAATGIPLITTGLWMLGPAIHPRKFDNINGTTIRAMNTGRILGLAYGAGLGLALSGNSDDYGKWAYGVGAVTSVLLGEAAFQEQKKISHSAGYVEMMRHYGFLGPLIGLSSVIGSGSDNRNVYGAAIVGGGIAGLFIGNHVARKYDYTLGDVDAVSSFTLLSAGAGFAAVAETMNKNTDVKSLVFIPAATSIAGTILAQHMVKGARLTDKQGSTINLSVAGAALVGLGTLAMTKSNSPAVWIGVPTGLGLLTHQLLFHNYKKKNQALGLGLINSEKGRYSVSLKVTPENYFLNKSISVKDNPSLSMMGLQNPIFKLTVKLN